MLYLPGKFTSIATTVPGAVRHLRSCIISSVFSEVFHAESRLDPEYLVDKPKTSLYARQGIFGPIFKIMEQGDKDCLKAHILKVCCQVVGYFERMKKG